MRASYHSSELWLQTHPKWLAVAAGMEVLAAVLDACGDARSRSAVRRKTLH